MQAGNIDRSEEFKNNSYQRARRTDAELQVDTSTKLKKAIWRAVFLCPKEEGNRPKRRKDKYNPYTIYENNGHYYISFKDREDVHHKIEISKTLYDTFDSFELGDLVYLNVVDRHIEQSEVWENTLNMRAMKKPDSMEEIVFRKLQTEKGT